MTNQATQTQPTQSQSKASEEQAEKLRRVLSVKDPAAAPSPDAAQAAKPTPR